MLKEDIVTSLFAYMLVLVSISCNWLVNPILLFVENYNIQVLDFYASLILHGLQIISVMLGLVLIYKQLKKK